MPVVIPPSIVPLPKGYRITAQYSFDGNESIQTPGVLAGTYGTMLGYMLDLRAIHGPANLSTVKALQFSLVATSSDSATLPDVGVFYVVVDDLQVFSFELVRNPYGTGFSHTASTATIPIQSTTQSFIRFLVAVGNYVLNQEFVRLYVNCFDFEVAPFVAMSHTAFVNPVLTITGTIPVDVVNTSMNVFVNNPVNLPVPVNQVP